MKARLISYTRPSEELLKDNCQSINDLVAYCARVSNPGNQNNHETSKKLINYLITNKHFSPLEMVNICLEIEAPKDICIQILRHRSFSFQEFSQRYADPTEELGFLEFDELREYRVQDPKNRQKSIGRFDLETLEDFNNENFSKSENEWSCLQTQMIYYAKSLYNQAIEAGVAKEQARALLPIGLIKSRIYMNGSLRSWLHYLQLRLGNGTQKEHVIVAQEVLKAIGEIFNIKDFI